MGAERSPKPSAMQMAGGFTVAVTRRESIDGHARGLMAAPPLVRRTQGGAAPAMRPDGQWAEGAVGWRCGLRASLANKTNKMGTQWACLSSRRARDKMRSCNGGYVRPALTIVRTDIVPKRPEGFALGPPHD